MPESRPWGTTHRTVIEEAVLMHPSQSHPQPWHVAARDMQTAWRGMPARQSSSCRVLTGGRRSALLMPACLLLPCMRIRQHISCAASV